MSSKDIKDIKVKDNKNDKDKDKDNNPTHDLTTPPGEIRGIGVIKDKNGKVKVEFTFGKEASLEEAMTMAKSMRVPLEITPAPVANELGTRIIPKP
jgi:hypothetical protein